MFEVILYLKYHVFRVALLRTVSGIVCLVHSRKFRVVALIVSSPVIGHHPTVYCTFQAKELAFFFF